MDGGKSLPLWRGRCIMMESLAPRAPGKHALAFIVATVLIDSIGFGIVIPVFPRLIVELTGRSLGDAARIGGWLALAFSVMQFAFGPLIGNLSDRFGRRPVLIACLLTFGVDYAVMGFASSIWLLLGGRLIAGVTGASFSPAYAYIADISPAEKRAANFGLLGLAFGLGFIIGPALGGLLGSLGTRIPFYAAAGLALVNALYGVLVLPESLDPENRRPFELARASPVGAFAAIRRLDPAVVTLAGVLFVWQVGHQALQATWSFYTAARFTWTPGMIGLSLAAVGLSSALVGGWLIRIIVPRIGERRAVICGFASGLGAFVIYGLGNMGWMMFAGIAVGAFSGLAYPSLNAMMSAKVSVDAQGELQGALSSLSSLATIIGPPLMTQLFAAFAGPEAPIHLPGAAFLLAAGLTLVALGIFLRTGATDIKAAAAG